MSVHDTTTPQKPRLPAFAMTNYRAISSGALKGVCDVSLPGGIRAAEQRWSAGVIEALREAFPEVLA
jgi:hypothetical protein